ncbi:MAG: 3-dehydroquinate synthase [Pyrinomonadaceae bacterium]
MPEKLIRIRDRQTGGYDVRVGRSILATEALYVPARARRALLVSNPKVDGLYGRTVERELRRRGMAVGRWLMSDGERFKSLRSAERLLAAASEFGLSRTDFIVALGGGVVGDLAGFAAAIYLRGVGYLQVPTTLLAMIDSSVGGKTGVNLPSGKNLVGAFHQPAAVAVDTTVLATLDRRELRAGLCEAVKHAALAGGRLFGSTERFLEKYGVDDFARLASDERFADDLTELLAAQIAYKASIVSRDPHEATDRTDARSRKVLNLGHTVGHALEKITGYRKLRHGEAVGYGLRAVFHLSKNLEILSADELESLRGILRRVGPLPSLPNINPSQVLEAISYDKKSIDGSVQWVLLAGIGKPVIRSSSEIPRRAVTDAIRSILKS